MHEDLKAAALAWVNGVREQLGRAPLGALPKAGDPPHSGFTCPMAMAVKEGGDDNYVYAAQECVTIRVDTEYAQTWTFPRDVKEFVRLYDAGEIPELQP